MKIPYNYLLKTKNTLLFLSISIGVIILFNNCSPKTVSQRYEIPKEILPAEYESTPRRLHYQSSSCNDWKFHVPDTANINLTPIKYLRVNFHIMNSSDSSHNFSPDAARAYLSKMLEEANFDLDSNDRNWRSPEGTAILPKQYRYVLWPQPDQANDDGFYFHYDDELYHWVDKGKNRNLSDSRAIQKYGIGLDSIMNCFLVVHHPDTVLAGYEPKLQGIALGNNMKMAGVFENMHEPFFAGQTFNHEIGHNLGLGHAWLGDGCDDTPNHPNNCWEWKPGEPCASTASNNMMDYNAYQYAITPCQLGRMFANLNNENHRIRNCLVPDWCEVEELMDVVVRDTLVLAGARDLKGNLIVENGAQLLLSCRVSMPKGAAIIVKPGGRLLIDGAKLHNSCGLPWRGIIVEKLGDQEGVVEIINPPVIENVGKK